MATDQQKLEEQVAAEAKQIATAPRVEFGAALTRCHFCGAVGGEVVLVETVNGIERYKGVACCHART